MALADEPVETHPAAADDATDDDGEQYGLGRGLGAILAPASAPAAGRGLGALFGAEAPRPSDDEVAPPSSSPPPSPSPPLPMMPRGAKRGPAGPAAAPAPDEIDGHLVVLSDRLDLDVALHVRPGPGGGRLTLHRPSAGSVPAPDLDRLCRAVRAFVAGRPTTDDLEAGRYACVAFGPRPLTEAGVYVLGRIDAPLTLDERWAVHRRLAPTALPA